MHQSFYGFLTFFNVKAAAIQHAKIFMELRLCKTINALFNEVILQSLNIQIIHE